MPRKVEWFAKGGGIARCGPFKTQVEAVNAMRLVKREATTRIGGDFRKGRAELALVYTPAQTAEFPADIFVWPEEL
jgi:hypothetical protein